MSVLFKNARAIVTCDDADTVLRGADLLMEGREIRALGKLNVLKFVVS